MRQLLFEERHNALWQHFEAELRQLEKGARNWDAERTEAFGEHYRAVCHHLAVALDRHYSGSLTAYLQLLCERGHKILYSDRGLSLVGRFFDFVGYGLPRIVRREKKLVLWAHILFYLPFLIAFVLMLVWPERAADLPGLEGVGMIEANFGQMQERHETGLNRDAGDNFLMTAWYIWNNIGIAFRAFASGLLFGAGTVYLTVMNGWVIGGAMGYMAHSPAAPAFFSFVGAHGAFELTGIVLAAAGGLRLGAALLLPGRLSRRDALRLYGADAAQLCCGAFLLLFIAAFVEGFWSPLSSLPFVVKYMVAVALWIGVYAYLFAAGRGRGGA